MTQLYNYNATVLKVVDGDTVDLRVDLGFKISLEIRVRLMEINAPEVSTPEGVKSREWLRTLLTPGMSVVVSTAKLPGDPYGRWLGKIATKDIPDLSQHILKEGYAVPYKEKSKP